MPCYINSFVASQSNPKKAPAAKLQVGIDGHAIRAEVGSEF